MKPNKKIFADEYSFDTRGRRLNSIHIRVWVYFLGFTVLMLALMWLLQIFFVNNYYEKMKIIESEKMTSDIIMSYRNGNQEILLQNIDKITMQDDVFIRIERKGTEPIVYSKELNAYKGEMEIVRRSLNKKKGKNKSVTMILTGKKTQRKTWAYGCYLDKNRNDILFVLSPLYPVTSTVKILMSQFIYISLISLLLAFILSYFLSSRITSPIRSITHAARQLARREYSRRQIGRASCRERV